MNIVRKFVTPAAGENAAASSPTCDFSLSLQHLKKLLAEFKHPPASATVDSQEKKFYNMLPLFCKVFDDPSNLKSIHQIFPEDLLFCSHASKLMVNEISRKARNQNTVSASLAICALLQPPPGSSENSNAGQDQNGHGWILLRSLCLMASAGPQLVDCMSASSLPSTLVKCVYLFYDLPSIEGGNSDGSANNVRRQEFENAFSSLLMTVLMSSPSTAEELARKTDLMLLVTAASSYCPSHNAHWHKTATQAIALVAKFGLKPSVISFMHSKGAVSLWVENLRQIGPPPNPSSSQMMDYVDMVLALVGFVQESTNFNIVFLEDFRQSDGYGLVARTIFAIELLTPMSDQCSQLMRNLLLASSLQLATAGPPSEALPPVPTPLSTVHIIPGFAPPCHRESAAGNCLSIRYVAPLAILSTVFNGAKTDAVCLLVLDVVNNLLQQDMNNYFWLEQESLLSDLLLKLPARNNAVQNAFFQVIEQVVTFLSYVPIKELNSIAMVFKQPSLPLDCRLAIITCLSRLAAYSAAFADAYRDMGIIELAVAELQRLAPNAKAYATAHDMAEPNESIADIRPPGDEFMLLANILDLLTLLVATSSKNADVIREADGSKIVLKLVAEEPTIRLKALMLLQSQILASGGEEELTQLLLLAQTCSLVDLDLKSHIFKVVVSILRQNHRCRSMFRRIAGFVYTISILVQLEGSLASEPKDPWKQVKRTDILVLIRLIFSTLTIVMRYEPANARHFAIEVKYANLAKAVRQLGCFPGPNQLEPESEKTDGAVFAESVNNSTNQVVTHNLDANIYEVFSALFHSLPDLPQTPAVIPKQLFSACLLFRFLLDMGCDLLDRSNVVRSGLPSPRPLPSTSSQQTMPSPLSIDIVEIDPQSFGTLSIVHPGAISAMIHLVSDVHTSPSPQAAYDLQWFIVSRLSDLMVGMRNQQVMAEAGLAAEMLTACSFPLAEERHFLHRPLVTIFERTAAHWLSTNDLRLYLRLGNPLNCLSPLEKSKLPVRDIPPVVPLERVKSLVSINTHRPTPPAVELDMRYEGFGCLFLPSVAPMMSTAKISEPSSSPGSYSPNTSMTVSSPGGPRALASARSGAVPPVQQVSAEARLLGGVGTGERVYPPASALSYSCWFCIDQFSVPLPNDRASMVMSSLSTSGESSHPIFLLLLTKQDGAREDSSDVIVSLAIFLTTGNTDRSVIVVTQEQPLTSLVECFEPSPEISAAVSSVSRFPLTALASNSPDSLGRWHHLVVTLGRPSTVLRYNNNLTVYLNGRMVGATKTSFVTSTPNFAANAANMVCAYIGTPPLLRRRSSLRWRLGPILLSEELMSANTVASVYNLGPTYTGSYQAIRVEGKIGTAGVPTATSQSLVGEERVLFVLHPSLMSSMTVAKIRKVFSKEDGRLVARQLQPSSHSTDRGDNDDFVNNTLFGMPSHENATPVRIIHNAAVHLAGPARSLGAVLVGYLGVRTFAPRPCSTVLESIGGAKVMLGLVSNADSETHLYAAMKALVTALRCNRRLGTHMRLIAGYQLLSLLLRRKQSFLSGHILQLILSYAGVVQLGPSPQAGGNGGNSVSSLFDSSAGLNRPAFRHLVCDLRIWQSMPCDIQQLLYEQLIELITTSTTSPLVVPFGGPAEQRPPILKLMFEAELPARLFSRLRDPSLSITNAHTVLSLLQFMFCDQTVLLQFGQFLAWLLPPAAVVDESLVNLDNSLPSPSAWQPGQRPVMLSASSLEANVYVIQLRNLCLRSLNRLIFQQGNPTPPSPAQQQSSSEQQNLNKSFVEALFTTLGPDWLMLFLQPHLHPSTVLAACNVIFALLADPSVVQKFREIPCTTGGGWLTQADVVIRARMGQLPGISVSSQSGVPTSPIGPTASIAATGAGAIVGSTDVLSRDQLKTEICKQPGFAYLYWLLPLHSNLPPVWFYLMGLFLGQPYRQPPSHARFDTDSLLDWALGSRSHLTTQLKIDVCPEAGLILLALARNVLSSGSGSVPPVNEYPQNLLQFIHYLFRNQQSLVPVITSQPFIAGMIATLFPSGTVPRQFASSSPIKNVAFDLFRSIYMASLSLPPLAIGGVNTERSGAAAITHSVATRTTSILGGVAGTIGATVGGGRDSTTSSSNTAKDPPTPAPLLDAFLTNCLPEDLSKTAISAYRTELITLFANSITSADVLANDKAVLSLMGNSYGNISANVFAFATRIADVLWSGTYTRPSHEIYEYLGTLLQQAKRKGGLPLEALYRPLNRTLLYQLSRPLQTAMALSSLIKALQTIHAHQASIFGPENTDAEFVACLGLCLLAFTGNDFPKSVNDLDFEATNSEHNETVLSIQELENSQSAVSSAARRVWEHVYLLRKNELEEATRTALSTGGIVGLGHDIETFRSIVTEPATRVWNAYIDEEKRRVAILFGLNSLFTLNSPSAASTAFGSVAQTITGTGTAAGAVIHRGITRMSSKVAGFTTGLLSRSRGSSESGSGTSSMLGPISCPSITAVTLGSADVNAWTQYHVSIVSELVNWRWQSNSEDNRIEDRRLVESWSDVERSLLNFPGLFGPPAESAFLKCQLSMAEGPLRMRKLMLPNLQFYEDYPLKNRPILMSSADDSFPSLPVARRGGKLRLPHSLDSDAWERESLCRFDTLFQSTETPCSTASLRPGGTSAPSSAAKSGVDAPFLTAGGGESEEMGGSEPTQPTTQSLGVQDTPGSSVPTPSSGMDDRMAGVASSKLLRGFLEEGDQVQHIYRCARVQGLDSIEGLLLFGSEHLYILDGFTLLKSKEIVEISRLPADLHRPIVPTTCYASGSVASASSPASSTSTHPLRQQHAKLRYSTIREVLKRRYLLQPIAIEVFSSDGRTVLLAFPHTQTRRAVFSRLLSVAQALLDSAEQSVAGQRAGAHVESSSNPLSALISDRSVTDRWIRNEISNFQYLMHLNTLAQRSYQDLMQYPVFPWILADYDSETLDLASTETFRDLSKPMGAQTQERVKQFEKRYREWEDSTGESGPYHYGTHYSSAMIVASYLVRMEPFTQIFLRLQGGCFDLPDRMFHSVREQWMSASRNNMTDVKELIPEFFYLPEFLINSNRFDFGTKQNGTLLDDAILPPWAHGSDREFVRIHRAALESDYVSAHLNEWIDLIFGYKQNGPDAVECMNVFHPYFYKGAVDIDAITDPVKRNATIGFINNFGQMPKQLFKRPHPTKRLSSEAMLVNSRLVFHYVSALQPAKNPIRELKLAVGQLVINERGTVLAVEQNKSLIPPNFTQYIAWGFADMSVRLGAFESDKTIAVYESLDSMMVLCALCPSPGLLLTAGKSSVINVWRLDTVRPTTPARLHAQLVGHSDAITCLSASSAYRILLSGSRNGVAIQWDLNGLGFIRELCRLSAPISALATNELTGDIAVCATTELHLFSINGNPLCAVNACPQENQQVLCVAFSQMNEWDDANVILTGGSDGVVRIWSLQYMQVPLESPTAGVNRLPIEGDTVSGGQAQQSARSANSTSVPSSVIESRFLIGGDAEPLLLNNEEVAVDVPEGDVTEATLEVPDSSVEDHAPAPAASSTSEDAQTPAGTSVAEATSTLSRSSTPSTSSLASISTPTVANRFPGTQNSTAQFVWRYQIVFRGKLTAHTAFDRNDNRQPAAVTALCLSRDHRSVFVGDARGRLLSWSVPDKPGAAAADHWVRDSSEARCQRCKTKFSVVERKHHCRDCGRVVCSSCSPYSADVVRIKAPRPVRVCADCYAKLNPNPNNNNTVGSPTSTTPIATPGGGAPISTLPPPSPSPSSASTATGASNNASL